MYKEYTLYIRQGYTAITDQLPPEGVPLMAEFQNKFLGTTVVDIEVRGGRLFSSAPEYLMCLNGCVQLPRENSTLHLVGTEVKFESFPDGQLRTNDWQLTSWKISPAYEQEWLDKFQQEDPYEDVTI